MLSPRMYLPMLFQSGMGSCASHSATVPHIASLLVVEVTETKDWAHIAFTHGLQSPVPLPSYQAGCTILLLRREKRKLLLSVTEP